ncbi:MAG: electron transport complex subunit RsxE [Bacilli bacterium]|nr:electron transport complex subunit RsxE [Bacilli bacterium]
MAKREKGYTKRNFLKGIIAENPLFISVLGTCPALATTKTVEAAIGMGILFTIVLICSNVLISLLRKIISEEIKTPAYIVIIATFVTLVKMFTNAFLPELYSTLGVFISLIVVNCIVLGRAEAYASKNNVFDSFIDAIGMGIGYTLAITLMAIFREFLGTGAFTFGNIFTFIPKVTLRIIPKAYAITMFQNPVGAFIVFGVILAVMAFIKNRKEELAAWNKKQAILKKNEEAKKAAALAAQQKAQENGGNK